MTHTDHATVAASPTPPVDIEEQVAGLLTELSAVQDELLELLSQKRKLLAEGDGDAMTAMQLREQQLVDRLQACHDRRGALLEAASREGFPATSIRALTAALPAARHKGLSLQVREASGRSRLLQHQCLTNWMLAQRSLIHLSQLLEIIATGGRQRPTYGKESSATGGSGSLLDGAA